MRDPQQTLSLLTFAVVQCVQLLYVSLTETFSLTEVHVGLFDTFYRFLAILGERVAPIMH